MRSFLFFVTSLIANAAGRASREFLKIASRLQPANAQLVEADRSTRYDMVSAPDEPYYAEQYWTVMLPAVASLPRNSRCLDLGCGQGRLTLRLAEMFPEGTVMGFDISQSAITAAEHNADERGLKNVQVHVSSIDVAVRAGEPGSVDLIVMTEVTFFYADWENLFEDLIRLLRPGGILAMSFRSQYFNALYIAREQAWDSVDAVINARRGRILPSLTEFSWQTSAEIRRLFERAGLRDVSLNGIGVCSGIQGDPHEPIARPSKLDDRSRQQLWNLELALSASVPDGGRYMLAIGRKHSP